jgi:2-polyprenyl-3-methyl-5-hydroxy-6-metoxy-1,4-benzoquinol methylase
MRVKGHQDEKNIARFFDHHSARWGRHYSNTGLGLYIFNRFFRRGLRQRWDITFRYSLPAEGKRYLDIGCGTGDYTLALAEAGASRVTGIDFAPAMIDVSRRRAAKRGLEEKCEFIYGDFMNMDISGPFDVVLAIGVFDYVSQYKAFWKRMSALSDGIVIGSFPGHSRFREPIRKWRYHHRDLPVYFYTESQLKGLAQTEGIEHFDLIPYSAGYALIGFVT